jgi:hypothetical protein
VGFRYPGQCSTGSERHLRLQATGSVNGPGGGGLVQLFKHADCPGDKKKPVNMTANVMLGLITGHVSGVKDALVAATVLKGPGSLLLIHKATSTKPAACPCSSNRSAERTAECASKVTDTAKA